MTDLFQPAPPEVEVATTRLPVVSAVEATTPLHAVTPTGLLAVVRQFQADLNTVSADELRLRVDVFCADLAARFGHAQPHVAPAWFAPSNPRVAA